MPVSLFILLGRRVPNLLYINENKRIATKVTLYQNNPGGVAESKGFEPSKPL